MKPIRRPHETKCQKCGKPSEVEISFQHTVLILCGECEEEFKKDIINNNL